MDFQQKVLIIVGVISIALIYAVVIELYKAAKQPQGRRFTRLLTSFGFPATQRDLINYIIAAVACLIFSLIINGLVGVIAGAITLGLLNGFFTKRKSRP